MPLGVAGRPVSDQIELATISDAKEPFEDEHEYDLVAASRHHGIRSSRVVLIAAPPYPPTVNATPHASTRRTRTLFRL
jgi:hypothetical protein